MTWLTWRQFRPQAVTSVAALAVFAILLAATGPHLAGMYASSGLARCQGGGCQHLAGNFLTTVSGGYTVVFMLGMVGVILAPALIGVFWGRRCCRASSRPGPTGWRGHRASPALAGWPASWRCPASPRSRSPRDSA